MTQKNPPHQVWGSFTLQCFVFFLIFAFSCLSFSSFPLLLDFLKPKSGPSNEVIGIFFSSLICPVPIPGEEARRGVDIFSPPPPPKDITNPSLYMGKMGSICHFPRALSASIWGPCSQILVFASIWGTQKGV